MHGNLLHVTTTPTAPEQFDALLRGVRFRMERIVSHGHSTPPGLWYDQQEDEWVLVVTGRAKLLIEGEPAPRDLVPGDYLLLRRHVRHRVEWTDPAQPTVWLALHGDVASSG
jgi:cupin 2 domain-containing protein